MDVRVHWLRWDRTAAAELPSSFITLLTPEEVQRSERLLVDHARRELIVGRALLRVAVARATGARPADVKLRIDEGGRPAVSWPPGAPSVNLTHCAGLLAVAICAGAVGVDAERIEARRRGLVRRFFHPDEATWVESGDPETFWTRFSAVWTLKEAVIKAHGGGLAVPLPSFAVAGPGGPADRTAVDGPLSLALRWPTDAHALAVAVRGDGAVALELSEETVDGLAREAGLYTPAAPG